MFANLMKFHNTDKSFFQPAERLLQYLSVNSPQGGAGFSVRR
jgi:hypothetical protein